MKFNTEIQDSSGIKYSDIREYAGRGWTELSVADRCYWASEYQRIGFPSTQSASLILWQHMKSIRKDWPDDVQRRADVDDHIALKQVLDRIADALSTGSTIQRS